MYGKAFESMYEGSMVGAGLHVFAVWNYCIAKNRSGVVELNPKLLTFVLAGNSPDGEKQIIEAIAFLCNPDPNSRSVELDGRRLVKEGTYQYRMVNWAHYDAMRGIQDQREYNRRKQAEYRSRKREVLLTGKDAEAYEDARLKSWQRRRGIANRAGTCDGASKAIEVGLAEAKAAMLAAATPSTPLTPP